MSEERATYGDQRPKTALTEKRLREIESIGKDARERGESTLPAIERGDLHPDFEWEIDLLLGYADAIAELVAEVRRLRGLFSEGDAAVLTQQMADLLLTQSSAEDRGRLSCMADLARRIREAIGAATHEPESDGEARTST